MLNETVIEKKTYGKKRSNAISRDRSQTEEKKKNMFGEEGRNNKKEERSISKPGRR